MRRLSARFAGVLASLLLLGCGAEQALEQVTRQAANRIHNAADHSPDSRADATPVAQEVPIRHGDGITIATFNIQVFGTKKESDPRVMQILADIVRTFDVVAIQEIRAQDQELISRFVELINSDGSQYGHVLGPRLGRTSSKEQYAYVFDRSRVEVDRDSVYTVDDPQDLLHREPLVARFRVRGPQSQEAFTFTLVNVHTDPDETDQELDALADVFRSVQQDGSGEDDVILLGDLNVDEHDLGRLGQVPGITYVVSGVATNTRGTKTYDNIVFDARTTAEYTGRWGVVDLMTTYQLSREEALDVSDHLPVWAAFSAYEGGRARIAAEPNDNGVQ